MTLRFGILVFPEVQQLDLTGPYEVFASAPGSEVHLIWKDRQPVVSATRLPLTPTTTFADCPPLDVLCIPGGSGINALLLDEEVLAFVRQSAAAARYVTSVCTGSLVLGAAGLLQGKRATTHWNAHDFLSRFGAVPVEGRVVQDGNLITAGGVTSGIDFGLAVIAELLGRTEAETIQLAMEYAPEPPFHSGTPKEASPAVLDVARRRLSASRARREEIIAGWEKQQRETERVGA
jgi:cyclohexyl-isocyanide hydratase